MPTSRSSASINATLTNTGYSLVARQESRTGYVSVLDNFKDGFRVMRCDHSLLGGEWVNKPEGHPALLNEPIYSIFVMLEAVRLAETEVSRAATLIPGHEKQALVIGLGVGTAPSALIAHGISTTTVEIDPVVHQFATQYFGLPEKHTSIIGDAVKVIDEMQVKQPQMKYDYIIHDVFTGGAEPIDLFTQEFLEGLRNLLSPEGTVAINYGGDLLLPSAASVFATVSYVFPNCRFFRETPPPLSTIKEDYTNLVMFCRKTTEAFTFRKPHEADLLGSPARREHLFPQNEITDMKPMAKENCSILRNGRTEWLEASQLRSARGHWYVMRKVLPDIVWEICSTFSSTKSSASDSSVGNGLGESRFWNKSSLRLPKSRKVSSSVPIFEDKEHLPQISPTTPLEIFTREGAQQTPATSPETPKTPIFEKQNPQVILEAPTPKLNDGSEKAAGEGQPPKDLQHLTAPDVQTTTGPHRIDIVKRKQSIVDKTQSHVVAELLKTENPQFDSADVDYTDSHPQAIGMQRKKIWVKRPGSSATQVLINEEDLVDDVRDMILKKYANSLGRNFDSPDVTLRIIFRHPSGRHSQTERTLGPEEAVSKILELYYPGGQAVEEALIIDVPPRRSPKHSPHLALPYYVNDDLRPRENGTDYFPPMPPPGQRSPHLPTTISVPTAQGNSHHIPPHSMSVITTGQLPNLPSPGGRTSRHSQHRPKYPRQSTSSPTVISAPPNALHNHDNPKSLNPPPLPTPPILEETVPHKVATPPAPRKTSPRPKPNSKRSKKNDQLSQTAGSVRDGTVPPINVLIVEDNMINLRLLEAFMKRLKVRWSTAMNGKDAVTKWREGGFHLVLMDIQLPVMNGLDATKEIRRLERVNNIGISTNSASSTPTFATGDTINGVPNDMDRLINTALFKSPVIIVALTASSLQSDRHEALAAGCNDFLTKPVNFEWLTRKTMEWGCMQALIDFDGWRKWKDFSQAKPAAVEKKAVGTTNVNKSPKANLNGKVPTPAKREKEKMTLGLGKENNSDNTGTGNDTTDSGT
ncbi:Two-component response regulator SSK1p [Lecanora helva]